MSEPIFMLSLQGPTDDGRTVIETWVLPLELYLHMRLFMEGEPWATSVTDGQGHVLGTEFDGGVES